MARLHTRRRTEAGPRIVAMPTFSNPESLDGLTAPLDPERIRKLPAISRQQDIALTVALTGLALLSRFKFPSARLSEMCGLSEADLPVALSRACGRKGDGTAKYFRTELKGGDVTFSVVMSRILRPERYVRLSVDALASAPTAAHARLYALAAEAAIGNDLKGTHLVRAQTNYLGIDRVADPEANLATMLGWVQTHFGDAASGHVLSAGIEADQFFVMAINSCNWVYDHKVAPRPWTDAEYWDRTQLKQKDGVWEGIDLTVDALRAAKVCEWVNKIGACTLAARWIRAHWLYELYRALAEKDRLGASDSLLDEIRQHGATAAFERWVLANSRSLNFPNLKIQLLGSEACALRRVAANDPLSRGLQRYATDPVSGESLCYLQYKWRVVDPILEALNEGRWSKGDVARALYSKKFEYRVGGREPKVLHSRTPMLPPDRLKAIGLWLLMHQVELPENLRAAAELAKSASIHALSDSARYDTIEEFLAASLDYQARQSATNDLRRRWRPNLATPSDGKRPPTESGTIEEAAMALLLEALAATTGKDGDASRPAQK